MPALEHKTALVTDGAGDFTGGVPEDVAQFIQSIRGPRMTRRQSPLRGRS